MAIEWAGLFANVGYSSANNKTQDDAVTGMQDTLYVTGPGYGAYEAIVRLYSSTGAVVATVNVSGGGGAFSAPPPVRFVDNGTTYSYSLEVTRGYIPTEDASGIVIRLVGGASKRYPSPVSVTPSGDAQFGGAALAPNLGAATGRWATCRIPQRFMPAQSLQTPGSQLTSGYTLYIRRPAPIKQSEGKILGVQVVVENFNTAATLNITLAKFATQTAQANPHGTTGTGTPVQITWDGAAGVNVPVGAVLPGGTNTGDDNPGRSLSDIITNLEAARTDGGEYALYDFRFLIGASCFINWKTNANPSGVGSYEVRDQFAGSDHVTAWDNYTLPDVGQQIVPTIWIIWYTTKGVITADLYGDSIMGGSGTVGKRRSMATLAAFRAGLYPNVIAHESQGYSSISQVLQATKGTTIASGKLAFLNCASAPNDPGSIFLSWAKFVANIEKLRASGALPIIIGPTPFNSPRVDILRGLLNESGYPWFDPIPYMGTALAFTAGYSDDSVHPNDAGADAAAPALAEFVIAQMRDVGF